MRTSGSYVIMRRRNDVHIVGELDDVESFVLFVPGHLRLRIAGHLALDRRGAVQRIRQLLVVVVHIDDRLEANLDLQCALRGLHIVAVAVDRVAGDRRDLPLYIGDCVCQMALLFSLHQHAIYVDRKGRRRIARANAQRRQIVSLDDRTGRNGDRQIHTGRNNRIRPNEQHFRKLADLDSVLLLVLLAAVVVDHLRLHANSILSVVSQICNNHRVETRFDLNPLVLDGRYVIQFGSIHRFVVHNVGDALDQVKTDD